MRQQVAKLWPVVFVGGCSLVYNENNINPPSDARTDSAIDAPADANAANLTITGVESPILLEGQGEDGSRPALLVIRGTNIVTGAKVTVAAAPPNTAMVEVVDEPSIVSAQSDLIAVKVIAHVDTVLDGSTTTDLVVNVSQSSPLGGMVEQTTSWQLKGLDELTGSLAGINTSNPREYSRVSVGSLTISGGQRVIVRATAGITVTNPLDISAATNSSNGGPGGFPGGASKGNGMGPGFGKVGDSNKGGGGGGFVTVGEDGGGNLGSGGAMTGDVLVTRYATNAGSGGGGSNDAAAGGGGGTLELTAGGNLSVAATITSNGGAGKNSTLAGGGGGGSGGVVVLRAGGTATVNGITVNGGAAGTSTLGLTSKGGAGRVGRARIDAATITGNIGPAHRGAMFAATVPSVVRTNTPTITVLGSAGDTFDLQRTNANLAPVGVSKSVVFGGADTLDIATPTLDAGFNRVCVVPTGSGLGNPESRNCIDLVYLP